MDMKRRIQEKLAHLTEWEREHLFELIQAEGVEPPERYEMLKQQFMTHLETELVHYHDWMVDDETKLVLRRKFLNVTGIWDIIPHDDLRAMIRRAEASVKRPVVDQVPTPWREGSHIPDVLEISALDLKQVEPFAEFFARFEKTDGVTYLDYLSGSREKRIHPYARNICFRRSLDDLLVHKTYVSASADPLTRTIYVSMCNADGKRRDFISICYELILENAFLDFYMTWPGKFHPFLVLRNMTIIALRFLAAVIDWLHAEAGHAPDMKWLDPYMPKETFLGNASLYKTYMMNLKDVFLKNNLLKIAQLNRKLGLDEEDLDISISGTA